MPAETSLGADWHSNHRLVAAVPHWGNRQPIRIPQNSLLWRNFSPLQGLIIINALTWIHEKAAAGTFKI